ncbi:MAG TPA: choice-of-anchor tandem repeat GloVer-containing protein, partial [Stellaceae bacterium]|nr:choice-of-anchor tandem repeat GloVer-containing protein [Stellaceae bacterium]
GTQAGVVMDTAGNLFGTTFGGGAHASPDGSFGGTVFELTPNAAKTVWTEKVLYSFCAQRYCADGSSPDAGLIMDAAGRLYGTTSQGGNGGYAGYGTVFELAPNALKTKWAMTVLHRFCEQPYCPEGFASNAGLITDRAGNLYGTTSQGGAAGGGGTAFVLTPNSARTKWTTTVLYGFCALGGIDCTDGAFPQANLVMDRSGHLYGTTLIGGTHSVGNGEFNGSNYNGGTVFELR